MGFAARLITMSPLNPCVKPRSTGTHNEEVKILALSSAFDRSNQIRTTAVTCSKAPIKAFLQLDLKPFALTNCT